jgi:hypothetical protein
VSLRLKQERCCAFCGIFSSCRLLRGLALFFGQNPSAEARSKAARPGLFSVTQRMHLFHFFALLGSDVDPLVLLHCWLLAFIFSGSPAFRQHLISYFHFFYFTPVVAFVVLYRVLGVCVYGALGSVVTKWRVVRFAFLRNCSLAETDSCRLQL